MSSTDAADAGRWRYFRRWSTRRSLHVNGNMHVYVQIEVPRNPHTEMGFDIDGVMDQLIELEDRHHLHHVRIEDEG